MYDMQNQVENVQDKSVKSHKHAYIKAIPSRRHFIVFGQVAWVGKISSHTLHSSNDVKRLIDILSILNPPKRLETMV